MELSFANAAIEKLCSNEREMKRRYGNDGARKLKTRLSELDAADRVGDLAAGNPHQLTGDLAGQYSLRLNGGNRLILAPVPPVPRAEDGSIAWAMVEHVMIMEIGDYHD
ncbi:MAG TPA: killer suppression protein HigA [Rhodospirillaceae bacterium]|nr:MAG: hypothetical protein A2018_01255 [Alphaproteobacteria bacterium GWF2_58_20]HAU29785.1 killer suppression protein HigA [Rhodospirillaceae bacterium]